MNEAHSISSQRAKCSMLPRTVLLAEDKDEVSSAVLDISVQMSHETDEATLHRGALFWQVWNVSERRQDLKKTEDIWLNDREEKKWPRCCFWWRVSRISECICVFPGGPCSSLWAGLGLVWVSLWSFLPDGRKKNTTLVQPDCIFLHCCIITIIHYRLQPFFHEHQHSVDTVHVDAAALLRVRLRRHHQQHVEALQRQRWQQVDCMTGEQGGWKTVW